MAISATNNLTTVDAADSTSDWTSDGGGVATYSGFQREGTACLGELASNGDVNTYHATTEADLSDSTIFGPWLRSGNPTTQANGGFRIVLGDGTNRAAYYVGGSDNYGFFFNGYSLFKLDLAQRSAYTDETLLGGGDASLDDTAIIQIGGGWDYGSKAVGNSDNVFLDIVRYIANGTAALVIYGGTSSVPGNFADIVDLDESTSFAFGVIREVVPGSKAYELNWGIDIGESTTASSYFDDSGFQLFISGENMSAGNMDVNILANSTGTNLFKIDNFVIVGIGTVSNWDLSTTNSNTMEVTNGQFANMGTFVFPVSGGTSRLATGLLFIECGTIDAGGLTFTDNVFDTCGAVTHKGGDMSGGSVLTSAVAADASALIYNVAADPDGETDNMTFSKGTNAHHAIELGTSSPLTMTFRDTTSTGFNASNAQNDSFFHVKRTSGTVTINIVGGTGNFSYKTDGATVNIIISPVTLLVNVKDVNQTNIVNARVFVETAATIASGEIYEAAVTSLTSSAGTATCTTTAAHGLTTNDYVVVRGAQPDEYNKVAQVTVSSTTVFTYSVDTGLSSPATGTPVVSFVAIYGLTDASGNVSSTRSWGAAQQLTGWARLKNTISPFYKQAEINYTVDTTNGNTTNAVLQPDE